MLFTRASYPQSTRSTDCKAIINLVIQTHNNWVQRLTRCMGIISNITDWIITASIASTVVLINVDLSAKLHLSYTSLSLLQFPKNFLLFEYHAVCSLPFMPQSLSWSLFVQVDACGLKRNTWREANTCDHALTSQTMMFAARLPTSLKLTRLPESALLAGSSWRPRGWAYLEL